MRYYIKGIVDLINSFARKEFVLPENSKYTWHEKDVLVMLDSISKHYPINGIVFNKDKEGNTTVVLGINAMTAILKCFAHPKDKLKIAAYNTFYDLYKKEFLFAENPSETQIPTQSLFDAWDCFQWERKMENHIDFDILLNEYQRISNVIDEFRTCVFTLYDTTDKEIQTIKERNNLFI